MSNKTRSKKQPIADRILDLINSLNSNLRIKKKGNLNIYQIILCMIVILLDNASF